MSTNTSLKGVAQIGDSLLSEQLEANTFEYLNWGLLGVGGFFNVTVPTSGCYGGDQSRLRLVDDPNYTRGQVWEGFRKDWVWESGIEYTTQPIRVSGVFVNGTFKGLSASGYSHHVDYPNGRVVFDTAINPSSTVACNYSYRLFQVNTADCPWWQEIQDNSFRVDDSQFLQQGSGAWDRLAQSRVQLPAIIIEAVPRATSSRTPLNIGSTAAFVRQDVLFHILTEDRWSLNQAHDILMAQWEKRLLGFDKTLMYNHDAYPLLPDGSPKASGLMYPDLVKPTGQGGYFWNQIRIADMRSSEGRREGNLRFATVRATCEVILPA